MVGASWFCCHADSSEAERDIGKRVPVVVNIESVDRIGVEPVTFHEGVRVHNQHGSVGVIGHREYEEVGQVQTASSPGCLSLAALKWFDMALLRWYLCGWWSRGQVSAVREIPGA
jgi:hypothetical protein